MLVVSQGEARTATEQKIYGQVLQGPAEILNLLTYYGIVALVTIGALVAIIRPEKAKFEDEYRFLMLGSLLIWVIIVAMPSVGSSFPIEKVLSFSLVSYARAPFAGGPRPSFQFLPVAG